MKSFTFLTEEQCFGKNKLKILDRVATEATDFAILLGADVDTNDFKDSYSRHEQRIGDYWLKSCDSTSKNPHYASWDTYRQNYICGSDLSSTVRNIAVRPVFNLSEDDEILKNQPRGIQSDGIFEIEYGFYPQSVTSDGLVEVLEKYYDDDRLRRTGNTFTIGYEEDKPYFQETVCEYEFQEERYVRVKVKGFYYLGNNSIYSGTLFDDAYAWVKVEPVKWLVDVNERLMACNNLLLAGIKFDTKKEYDGNFDETNIKRYMDKFFVKELTQSVNLSLGQNKSFFKVDDANENDIKKEKMKKQCSELDFSSVSEEDIIKASLEQNIPLFLHGKSSDGKLDVIKKFDPDYEIIHLKDVTYDGFTGESANFNIYPSRLYGIFKKCKDEPDKIHILVFEGLTKIPLKLQHLIYDIVRYGKYWDKEMPANARIVAMENDLNDSLDVEMRLPQPFSNVFAHVYMNMNVNDWLNWAFRSKNNYQKLDYKKEEYINIHPAIYAYFLYKDLEDEDVLEAAYDEKNGIVNSIKWEMASKILQKTGKPEMLRAFIGKELTKDFIAFVRKRSVITIDDVLNKRYSNIDLKMSTAEKYVTLLNLSFVDFRDMRIVRDFVMDNFGESAVIIFEKLWICGDEDRYEYVMYLNRESANIFYDDYDYIEDISDYEFKVVGPKRKRVRTKSRCSYYDPAEKRYW